jgi:PAS domain S-box-containing protein/putative nucleotidyltransferase with HDIG domain
LSIPHHAFKHASDNAPSFVSDYNRYHACSRNDPGLIMKKYGLWIVLILVFAGIILGTLGTWSIPLGYGLSAFWPAIVVQVAGGAWFGGWGVLAAVIFPIFTNALANVGLSGILGFIPGNLAQGLIPAWAFRHFRVDPAIPGRKGLVFYIIWGALIPATAGGLLGSAAVVFFGEASWSDYPLLVVKWAAPNMVVSLLIGILILRELTPLWRDLGILTKGWWTIEQASSMAASRRFRDMPIQLKLVLAMCGTGIGPLLVLSLLELARNGGHSAPGTMTPLFLTISLMALVLAVGFLSRETVRPLQELQEQVESLMQHRDGVLKVERADEIGQLGQAFAFLLDDWRHAEASLQASEEKYRTLVENLNVGIFQSTINGTFLHANSALIHLAGYDSWDEFKRLSALHLYADEADRERLITGLEAQGRVWNVETRSVKRNGTIYWIAISAVLLKDSEGKPASILGSVIDITDRKRADEALRESEEWFQTLAKISPIGIFRTDSNGATTYVNPKWCDISGLSVDKALGDGWVNAVHPDDKENLSREWQRSTQQKRASFSDYRFVRPDGSIAWVIGQAVPEMNSENQIIGYVGTITDITERKKAEQSKLESLSMLESTLEATDNGILVVGESGKVIHSNQRFARMWRIPEELIASGDDKTLLDHVLEQLTDPQSFIRRVETLYTNPETEAFDILAFKDGRVFERASCPMRMNGKLTGRVWSFRDITERKQIEEELRISEQKFSKAFLSNPDSITLSELESGRLFEVNDGFQKVFGFSREEAIGRTSLEMGLYQSPAGRQKIVQAMREHGNVRNLELKGRHKSGSELTALLSAELININEKPYLLTTVRDITERKRVEEALVRSEERYRALFEDSPIPLFEEDFSALKKYIDGLHEAGVQDFRDYFKLHEDEARKCAEMVKVVDVNKAVMNWYSTESKAEIQVPLDKLLGSDGQKFFVVELVALIEGGTRYELVSVRRTKDGDIVHLITNGTVAPGYEDTWGRVLISILDITARRRAEETLRQRLAELEAVHTVSAALRTAQTLDNAMSIVLEQTLAALETNAGTIWLYHPASDELSVAIHRGWFSQLEEIPIKPGEGIAGRVFASGQAHLSAEFASDPVARLPQAGEIPAGWSGACVPIRTATEAIGVLFVSVPLPRQITPEQMKLLTLLAEMAGAALHRMSLYEETERQLKFLKTLHEIDSVISAGLDLRLTLQLLIEHTIAELGTDAADVLLLHPHLQTLDYFAGRGFHTNLAQTAHIRLGESFAGRAALERRIVRADRAEIQESPPFAALWASEGFAAYYAVPLIAKGEVRGVLEVYQCTPFNPGSQWLGFLETFAGQAAIAIDNMQLFDNMQRSNVELTVAYDTTIQGWSHALDLRDRETEGHTQRVAELTEQLAGAMGIGNTELVHIRRGALLHDIGKMGVPDSILLKPGKLSAKERGVMRKHPIYAHDMLSRIEYLKPALDIPYCHHEKWDGTGYPQGLKGEEIPPAARMFAIIDVWDALSSDRPYRKAWQKDKIIEYIKTEAGKRFDPCVVNLFLDMVERGKI